MSSTPHRTSRRADLQRELGDAGEVLPRVMHGTSEHPAQGWYARMNCRGEGHDCDGQQCECSPVEGTVVFLGDYALLAGAKIMQLVGQARNGHHA